MRLAGWHVDGFGHLCDLEAHDLPDGLVVLHGENEAGKSTLVDFIGGVLFGFPTGSTRAEKRPPLRGGQHGGRLWLADGEETILVARAPRSFSARRASDDAEITEAQFNDFLGTASRRLFDGVFSVDLDALRSLDAISDAELNDLVFSAGVVGAGRSATVAIERLEARRNDLYRPRGRPENYPILQLRANLREAGERLLVAQRAAANVPALRRAIATTEQEASEQRESLASIDGEIKRIGVLVGLWSGFVGAVDARRALAALPPELPLDAGHTERLGMLEASLDEANMEREQASDDLAAAEAELATIEVDAQALAVADAVEELQRRRAVIARDRDSAAEHRARMVLAGSELEQLVAALGAGFDRSSITASGGRDIAAADGLAVCARSLTEAGESVRAAAGLRRQLEQDRADQCARSVERQRNLLAEGPLDEGQLERRIISLDALDRRIERFEENTASGVALAPTPGWLPMAMGVVALAFLVAGCSAAVMRPSVEALLLVGGGVLLSALAALTAVRDRAAGVGPTPGADEELVSLAAEAGMHEVDRSTVRTELNRARERRDSIAARRAALATIERERLDAAQAHEARLARITAQCSAAVEAHRCASAAWSGWLAEHDFPAGLSPVGAQTFAETLGDARLKLDEIGRIERLVDQLEGGITRFASEVRVVAEAAGSVTDADALVTLDLLVRRVQLAREAATAARVARQTVAARRDAAGRAATRARGFEEAIAELLAEAQVGSPGELREAVAAAVEHTRLQAEIDAFDRSVVVAVGHAAAPGVWAALAAGEPATWEARRRELDAYRAESEARRDENTVQAKDLERRLEALERSADVPTAALEVVALRGELRAAIREFAVLGLAKGLLSETLARYQRERQPKVLIRAQELFAKVTNGAYPKLRTEGRAVIAVDRTGRDVPATTMSRGTREQLYLCLRFALAESFADRARLPIVLDDVLVNFDPARAKSVAEVIAEVARHHQVLSFTCHPWVRDALLVADPHLTELPLDRNTGALVPVRHRERGSAVGRESA